MFKHRGQTLKGLQARPCSCQTGQIGQFWPIRGLFRPRGGNFFDTFGLSHPQLYPGYGLEWSNIAGRPSNRTLVIPAWSDGILACLDPGAGFFLIILTSATLSYTLGLVWNDQMSWADQNEKCCQRGSHDSQSLGEVTQCWGPNMRLHYHYSQEFE